MRNVKHYIARVTAIEKGTLRLTVWPYRWKRVARGSDRVVGEFFANVTITGKAVTASGGKLHRTSAIEMWTWNQNGVERLHIRRL